MQYVGFHRKMDEFVFDSYVKRGLTEVQMAKKFAGYRTTFEGKINFGFFTLEYCNEQMSSLYKRMQAERTSRMLGFTKEKDFRTTVIKRFIKNKSTWAFLPQENLAKVWGCSQRSISRYLNKMVVEGFLVLDKKHSFKSHRAAEYRLASRGLKLLKDISGIVLDKAVKIASLLTNVIVPSRPDKKEIAKRSAAFRAEWSAWLKIHDPDYEPFPKKTNVDIPF